MNGNLCESVTEVCLNTSGSKPTDCVDSPHVEGTPPSTGVSILSAVENNSTFEPAGTTDLQESIQAGDTIVYRSAPSTEQPSLAAAPLRLNYVTRDSQSGQLVEFSKLLTDSKLNGDVGLLDQYVPSTRRWIVQLLDGRKVCARCGNLIIRDPTDVRVAAIRRDHNLVSELPPPGSLLDAFDERDVGSPRSPTALDENTVDPLYSREESTDKNVMHLELGVGDISMLWPTLESCHDDELGQDSENVYTAEQDATLGTLVDAFECFSITAATHPTKICGVSMAQDGTTDEAIYVADENSFSRPRILKLIQDRDGGLADPGANICMTYDKSILLNLRLLPAPISVGVAVNNGGDVQQSKCTHVGDLPLRLENGGYHYQRCYYNPSASETFISPQAIVESCPLLRRWTMSGHSDRTQGGMLSFATESGDVYMSIPLTNRGGLYYCEDTFVMGGTPLSQVNNLTASADGDTDDEKASKAAEEKKPKDEAKTRYNPKPPRPPTSEAKQLESVLWNSRLGFPSEFQMEVITTHADGLPAQFAPHPFEKYDLKMRATIQKQPAGRFSIPVELPGQRYYMDFSFMRASTAEYSRRNKTEDRVVQSFDGYNSHLIIVDEVSRYVWVFLTKSKEPPIDIVRTFLAVHGNPDGGLIRTDQGGELARSAAFRKAMVERSFPVEPIDWNGEEGPVVTNAEGEVTPYVLETTGADSPSQNGAVERWNKTLGNTTRVLLYGAGLEAKYWSAALLHAVYLHNRRVHKATNITPFEAYFGLKPNLRNLKLFGSKVCVRRTGTRQAKLDEHAFDGIFLGYAATEQNIRYLDLHSGVVKRSHHAIFDEAWYSSSKRPPAARFLYELGLRNETLLTDMQEQASTRTDPMADPTPDQLPFTPLLRRPAVHAVQDARRTSEAHSIIEEYGIGAGDMAMVYISTDPFGVEFDETLNIGKLDTTKTPTAGLLFTVQDDRLILSGMSTKSPGDRHRCWRSRLKGAWLISVAGNSVSTRDDVVNVFAQLERSKAKECKLLFAHPEKVFRGAIDDGIPIIAMDQLNNRHLMRPAVHSLHQLDPLSPPVTIPRNRQYQIERDDEDDNDVFNLTTRVNKLTRRKLVDTDEWSEWQQSEWLQLDQYEEQHMFGRPVPNPGREKVFDLVWTYVEKVLDKRKKARCTMDGSARNGNVRVLDHTYANCVEQTGSRLFYAASAIENLVIFGADASNAFGEAPPPKQGAFIRPDKAFREWWWARKGERIPEGYVIPVLRAMQGHPESPRLWERHIDRILREELGLTPTVHEPCLYSGEIEGERVLFLRQVDDFACAAPSQRICDIIFDMMDDHLTLTLKRLGSITLFNGIDVQQSRDYNKISVETFIDKACDKYKDTWLKEGKQVAHYKMTPLPSNDRLLLAKGDPDEKAQRRLAKEMDMNYRSVVGELTYAMITCRPDIAYAVVKLAQANTCPSKDHYLAAQHCMRYLHETRSDGIYYWRSTSRADLAEVPVPDRKSTPQSRLDDGRPEHSGTDLHCFVDSDWATDPLTRRSFTGICLRFAGGTIGYKTRFQPTVALSSTEAEFMAACDAGKMLLYVRSILYDLGIPQDSASVIYEDNDGATAMANAKKPTTRTRHMDIRYFALCDWVERDLVILERVDTSQNLADHFTKRLDWVKFACHNDYIMGRAPPPHSPKYCPGETSDVAAKLIMKLAQIQDPGPYEFYKECDFVW